MPKIRHIAAAPPPFARSIRAHHDAYRLQDELAASQWNLADIASRTAILNVLKAREILVAMNGRLVAAGFELDDRVEVGGHIYQVADGDDSPAAYLGREPEPEADDAPSLRDDLAERAFEYSQMTHIPR
jgi:hypothetical protein